VIELRSSLRRKVLAYYFTNPTAEHYLRELARLLEVDPANLSRELARLERMGLFASGRRGNQKHFRLNKKYPLFGEVRRIVARTVGIVPSLRMAFRELLGIREAYLYGSFARNQQDALSDIDVLIVGRPPALPLERLIRKLEGEWRREINYTVLSPEEFRARRSRKDAFLADIWRRKKIALVEAA